MFPAADYFGGRGLGENKGFPSTRWELCEGLFVAVVGFVLADYDQVWLR